MTRASSVVAPAVSAADKAMRRAGVMVLELDSPAATERAADLLRQLWHGPEVPVPSTLLRTVQHTGGYAFGAYDRSGALLAVSVGLLAREGLHSHITGVLPSGQRRGLGHALKQHQRCWSIERGITTIRWTCDPLVRRNVGFNLHALGAQIVTYLPDHYGSMTDGINRGDESDRFELSWDLLSPATLTAAESRLPWVDCELPYAVRADELGRPVVSAQPGACLVQLPADIEDLRRSDPATGRAWRRAVRDALARRLADGGAVRGLTSTGALVLDISQ